jgi:hypothetical protein
LPHGLRGGFASEAIGTLRSLHEAAQRLSTLSFHEEQDVLRRRLAGEYVRPTRVLGRDFVEGGRGGRVRRRGRARRAA